MRTVISPQFAGTADGSTAEAVLRACVHCGFCNATCPTYRLTGDELDGPRGRIYLIKQALEGGPVSRVTQHHLDRCLSCRACETTCPSGVAYHRLYDVGRAVVAAKVKRPWRKRLARWAIRTVASNPVLFGSALALGRALRPLAPRALAGKIPRREGRSDWPAGGHTRRMLVLQGCVQRSAAPQFNTAMARVFDRLGVSLEAAPQAGCCGALHAHLDATAAARRAARRNIDAWLPMIEAGAEAILINASGCAVSVREYPDLLADDPAYVAKARAVAALVRDPVEVLEAMDLAATRPPAAARIAVHEPCTQQHGLKLTGRVTGLLRRLGYEPQPVQDAHLCCGSAGAYSLLQPQIAGALRADKLAKLTAGEPAAIYTGNIGCWMHLAETSAVPVRHWIEAVEATEPTSAAAHTKQQSSSRL
ncbi:MAG: glycolate oxidase subunit GlcF [Phenylobacterium sp.]